MINEIGKVKTILLSRGIVDDKSEAQILADWIYNTERLKDKGFIAYLKEKSWLDSTQIKKISDLKFS